MVRNRRNRRKSARPQPYYDLEEVRELARSGKVVIRKNAKDGARAAFGWKWADILSALSALERRHFYKTEVSVTDRRVVLDFYKGRGLKGENVYTHFYVDDETDRLVVNSFKEI